MHSEHYKTSWYFPWINIIKLYQTLIGQNSSIPGIHLSVVLISIIFEDIEDF